MHENKSTNQMAFVPPPTLLGETYCFWFLIIVCILFVICVFFVNAITFEAFGILPSNFNHVLSTSRTSSKLDLDFQDQIGLETSKILV